MLKKNKVLCKIIASIVIGVTLSTSGVSFKELNIAKAQSVYSSQNTVQYAISNQNSGRATIEGYIIGEPIDSTKILTQDFRGDNALVISSSPNIINKEECLYIQIPKALRERIGLLTNPNLVGKKVTITGDLLSYFGHAGIKNINDISFVNGEDKPNIVDETKPDETKPVDETKPENQIIPTVSDYDSTYYKGAIGKNGITLKNELHKIINNHKKLSYSDVWEGIKDTDEDPLNPNNVILLYTGRSQSKSSNGAGVNDWNREHVWAKSHGDFGTKSGAGTDLHHLRATDASVNSTRGSKDFDMGGNIDKEATECRYDSDSWEPRDSVKGDIARMLFYMAVRYEGENGEPDLELNNKTNLGKEPYIGKLDVLLEWNRMDPVDDIEKRRNEIIYTKYQHNRNPFIDHPEMADLIWRNN